jgi:hypothetical protein
MARQQPWGAIRVLLHVLGHGASDVLAHRQDDLVVAAAQPHAKAHPGQALLPVGNRGQVAMAIEMRLQHQRGYLRVRKSEMGLGVFTADTEGDPDLRGSSSPRDRTCLRAITTNR